MGMVSAGAYGEDKDKVSVATAECLKNWSDVNGRDI